MVEAFLDIAPYRAVAADNRASGENHLPRPGTGVDCHPEIFRAPLDLAYAVCNSTHCVNQRGRHSGHGPEEHTMAKRRSNPFTSFVSDIVDATKDLADDMLDRAKTVESNAKDAVKDAVDDE